MNIIVTNKYKNLIYSSNIEILKELNGVYTVNQIANSFNSIFYKKIVIDATALADFPKETVLKELVNSFDREKIILFLPPDNPPPKKFLSFLVSLNLYNFTDNVQGLVKLIQRSNTLNDVKDLVINDDADANQINNQDSKEENLFDNTTAAGRIVLGFKSITDNTSATNIVYMIKKSLESVHHKKVYAVEVDKREFVFYNEPDMYSVANNQIIPFINNHLDCDVLLVDMSNNVNNICDDVISLINPSLYDINKLMFKSRDAFVKLKGEKIVFVNSLLSSNDVNKFANEANINVYFNLSPLNDRIHNENLDKFLAKLGIIEEKQTKSTKKGLFDIFK